MKVPISFHSAFGLTLYTTEKKEEGNRNRTERILSLYLVPFSLSNLSLLPLSDNIHSLHLRILHFIPDPKVTEWE